ncbi:MAG: hypothetical protein WCB93_00820, partial [Gallionella sp.]
CDAWQDSGDPLFAGVVEQTAAWVMREMQSPLPNPLPIPSPQSSPASGRGGEREKQSSIPAGEGTNESLREITIDRGYYSSLDADSEHEEGKFYVWQRDEIRALLGAEEYAVVERHYGLDRAPNFENHAWNLRVSASLAEIAASLNIPAEQASALLDSARKKLFAARTLRIRPGRDEKILAAWNGLMIAGMAHAARVFVRPDWLHSAQQAIDFVRTTLWRDGKLLATCRNGKAHLNAYLDDHAFLLNALLELLQAEYRSADMAFALQLADALLERFEDKQDGGFFFTSHDHEVLIQRNKIGTDNATPSGNGIAAQALLRLSLLTGKPEYAEAAERCLKLFFPALLQDAGYHCSLCTALAEHLQPPSLLVLRGPAGETDGWRNRLRHRYLPGVITIALADDIADLPGALDKPRPQQGAQAAAWLCHGTQCLPPITDPDELLAELAPGRT